MSKLLSVGLAALLAGTCMQAPAASSSLECRVEPRASTEIRFVLTNSSREPVWVLKWNTPLEGRVGTIFTVTGPDGTELPYTGPMVKRGDPGRDDYVQIPSGGEVDAVADLANVYDLSKPGRYRVQVTGGIFDLTTDAASVPRPREQHQRVELQCGEVELEVASRAQS